MAKTQFVDGTVVPTSYLNSAYYTNGGHKHDGGSEDGSAAKIVLTGARDVSGLLPRTSQVPLYGYRYGLEMGPSAIGDAQYVSFGAGCCAMANAAEGIHYGGELTKQVVDAAGTGFVDWEAAGDGGVAADLVISDGLWLHAFALRNSVTGAINFGFDTSVTAANLVSGDWTQYRRVGSIQIVADDTKYVIRPFKQYDKRFLWSDPVLDALATEIGYAAEYTAVPLTAPAGVVTSAILSITALNNDGVNPYVRLQYQDGVFAGAANAAYGALVLNPSMFGSLEAQLMTDVSRQVYFKVGLVDTTVDLYLWTRGWDDILL